MIFLITLILNQTNNTLAQEIISRDVAIQIMLDLPEEEVEHTRIFRAENLDHTQGTTDLLHFFINSTITGNNQTLTWNTTRTINKYAETGMGTLNLTYGKYELCTNIMPLNFYDYNLTNNHVCKTIKTKNYFEIIKNESECEDEFQDDVNLNNNTTTNTTTNYPLNETTGNNTATNETINLPPENITTPQQNITAPYENETNNIYENKTQENTTQITDENICQCELQIITEKQIYSAGESIQFLIKDCANTSSFQNPIEYWVEDLFSTITKTKIETTTKTTKTHTPRITDAEKTFLLKAKITECNETYTKIVTIKNTETEEKETYLKINTPNHAKPGDIIIVELDGYKGQMQKTLINLQLELDGKKYGDVFKIYVQKQNTEFNLKIPFKITENLKEGELEYSLKAEGLGLNEQKIITINKATKESEQENNLNNDDIIINSFYTLKRKYDGTINAIITWQGETDVQINIITQNETHKINTFEKKVTIPLNITSHDEVIIAELISNNITQDIAILKLNLERDEQDPKDTKHKDELENLDINKIQQTTDEKIENTQQTNTTNNLQNEKNKTKKEIHNLENETIDKMPQINNMSFIKNNKKQIIFAAIVIISIILLFSKEIKNTIRKKAKNKKLIKK
ncbi:MAG: hypothetical protein ACLFN8_05395 [Candidatus Woesearchaeota archaeon]